MAKEDPDIREVLMSGFRANKGEVIYGAGEKIPLEESLRMILTKQELRKEVKHFYETQKKYYNDELDDKELANEVTQPFWQSMRLMKRRLKSKGLRMEMPVWEVPEVRANSRPEQVRIHQDGSDIIGESICDVVAHRSFWRDNKKIYSKKEKEICAVHTLKANVQEEEAACPNCGHIGKISEYIDGCDYCGCVFTVNDFEAKISGFSLEENIADKVKKILKGAAIFCAILGMLLILLTILSFVGIVKADMAGNDDKGLLTNLITMVVSANTVPAMWSTFIGLVVVNGIVGTLLICLLPKQITGENIVKAVISEFSAQDFLQNLEYKIRNIHFAESDEEAVAFTSCDMKDIVKQYEDVVDCSMRKLRFTDIRQDEEKYYLRVTADLKLSMYNGRRIRNKHERVNLAVSGKKEVFLKDTWAIREYKCPNCSSSVSLLEGGNCEHCGTKLDYENYSWLIDEYENKLQAVSSYGWIKLGFIGIFLVMLLYNLSTTDLADNEIWELYEEVNQAEQVIEEFFEDIEMPEELGLDVQLETMNKESRHRTYHYVADDAMDVAELYVAKLEELGYIYDEKYSSESQYIVYMPAEYENEKAYFKLRVQFDESNMLIDITIVEFVGE